MKPLTSCLLSGVVIVLLLRTTLSQSNHRSIVKPTSSSRFPELHKIQQRLSGVVASPDPKSPKPSTWGTRNARSESSRTSSDSEDERAPLASAGAEAEAGAGAGAGAAPKELRAYPTLATSKLQPPERNSGVDGRNSGVVHPAEIEPTMSSYSQFKWDKFGRRSAFETYRNNKMKGKSQPPPHQQDIARANQHNLQMNSRTACKAPRPKVVNVKEVYNHPGKSYIPTCTLLHRCSDDTACCKLESYSCRPLRTENVTLFFYSSGSSNSVVSLVFENHTECSCQNKYEHEMPRDMAPSTRLYEGTHQGTHARHRHAPPAWTATRAPKWTYPEEDLAPVTPRPQTCRCPKEFQPRGHGEGNCTCECFDRQQECLHLKRGTRYFPYQDKICIEKGHCHPPLCEFGPYLQDSGRCTRKHEFSSWSQPPAHKDLFH